MKLHNLITDEICEAEAREDGIYVKANWSDEGKWFLYDLHTLASCWEYYVEPKKPLIKNEKIRKAVRAWADMNDIRFIHMCSREDKRNARIVGQNAVGRTFTMEINDEYSIRVSFEDYKECYTIAELCGEGEE
jgi:hypothetical protein